MSMTMELALEAPKPQPRQITKPENMLVFALAGHAHFTLVSKKTGLRFTYSMTAAPDNAKKTKEEYKVWFVGVLTGPDNQHDYSYMGTIRPGQGYRPGVKSRIDHNDPEVKSPQFFTWFWQRLLQPSHWAALDQIEFWHEGHCCRCGRMLTVPESIERGIGPECMKKVG